MVKSLIDEFGIFRSFFWPVHGHEVKKILPMVLMCFLICFNYSLLRNLKDSVVITASGAEVVPFIKVWALLPMAIILTFLFTKLSNRFSFERVFYMMTSGFLAFFAIYIFILYPMREQIHFHRLARYLTNSLPGGFYGFIEMFCNWSSTLFYVFCELWQSIVFSVLFWGLANEITKISEARRFYSVLSIGSNVAAIVAGQVGNYFSDQSLLNTHLPYGRTPWEQTTMNVVGVVILSGLSAMGIFWWMNRNVLNTASFDDIHNIGHEKKEKKRLSLRESFVSLSNSKYLLCIAVLVVGYNLVINLVEIIWKDQLNTLYPSPAAYNHYLNNLTSLIGIISTITSFFMVRIIGRFGWTLTAMITPAIMMVTSVGFFTFYFFHESLEGIVTVVLGTTPLTLVVFFGGAQNCLSKAAKYSVFDTTKEMSFIPLDHEIKLKGKAAIDGVGSKIGKSGGSIIYQTLLMFLGNLSKCAPYVATILMGAIAAWIVAVKYLGEQFQELIKSRGESEVSEREEPKKPESLEEQPATA